MGSARVESDSLVQVGKCLERNDIPAAVLYLDDYVRDHPDQLLFRLQLAELCVRCDRAAEAKFHYERFIADAQTGPATVRPHIVTAHTKLMEIAQRRNDRFGELFHRGVGLLLLVKQLDADKEGRRGARVEPAGGSTQEEEAFREEMLCKSLKALQDAKGLKPGEPRVRVYLAEAYERTGNRGAAVAERSGAKASVTSGELTVAERRLPLDE